MPVEFFERHLDKVEWDGELSGNINIPVEFFERHLDKVNWFWLSGNTNIPVEFFERHLDNVDWKELSWGGLSINTNMSPEFFERHLDKVNWRSLSGNEFNHWLAREQTRLRLCAAARKIWYDAWLPYWSVSYTHLTLPTTPYV